MTTLAIVIATVTTSSLALCGVLLLLGVIPFIGPVTTCIAFAAFLAEVMGEGDAGLLTIAGLVLSGILTLASCAWTVAVIGD